MQEKKTRINPLYFILITLFLFIVVLFRAYHINITHDEAYSFYLVHTNYLNALATTANTHILNSLSMKFFNFFELNHWFYLRMHSVLSFLIFSFFVYRFLVFFKSKSTKISFFIIMLCNPFTLDYFSLARGYALCYAMFFGAIFYTYSFLNNPKSTSNLKKIFLFSSLSLLSNYTVLYPIGGMLIFVLLVQKRDFIQLIFSKKILPSFLVYVSINVFAIVNMLLIKYISNDLQYGADHSFIHESLNSLTAAILFQDISTLSPTDSLLLSSISIIIIGISIFSFLLYIYKKNKKYGLFSFMFLFTFVLFSFTHIVFSTPYPFGRTMIVFVPIIFIQFFFLVESFNKRIALIVFTSFTAFFLYVFTQNFSINYTLEWRNQSEVQKVISETITNKPANKISIICDESYHAVLVNYYKILDPGKYAFEVINLNATYPDINEKKLIECDYFIISHPHLELQNKFKDSLKIIRKYSTSQTEVYKIRR